MMCPICNNSAPVRLKKLNIEYRLCDNCKTLFSAPIDQDGMVGGEHEVGRNESQNHLRIARVNEMATGIKKEDVRILDWGCGHAYLINDLKKEGYLHVDGYDPYTEEYCRLPEKEKYHIITAIEVIEHTSFPFIEIDTMHRSLVDNGVVMVETSFTTIAEQEGISLDEFFYVAPQNGHSTIFSHHGLDLLFNSRGFIPRQHFDRNVRLYSKRK